MLQETCARLAGIEHAAPLLICGEDHRFTVAEQLRLGGFASGGILLEPAGRNTAPAVALAAMHAVSAAAQGVDGQDLLLILAADHVINDVKAFQKAVGAAAPLASDGKLVTFGIVPAGPETGYGYIRRSYDDEFGGVAYAIAEFVEKPNQELAEEYLRTGGGSLSGAPSAHPEWYWNSGMFLIKASRYLDELKSFRPDIYAACEQAMGGATVDADFIRPQKDAFLACPDDSIDYAVMEKTRDAVVVPMDCGWSDVGSWSALWEVSEQCEDGNRLEGDVIAHDTTNTYVHAGSKLVATVGLDDMVVVDTPDAILVAKKERVQDVKKIVEQLKHDERPEAVNHRQVYRPWGSYDSIDMGERFQVKRIVVNPGAQLSLQMHHHRAEHWIVVSGTAMVTCGEKEYMVTENQSTYIPLGEVHRLKNPGKVPLEMIEVQSGSYLGEDDIVRFEDMYSRD
ncbi:mannose-1-phosphate guanyltransferase [Biformimicrobium ophioploci]|uniref:mannose-1-phosphate guanylyltransferase n=2 Tax=Biformimicrobium ophioploci TaxID=3036711 RepID=A0ABQ6LWZ8_9GAMM|nr:mannose-1-phosphate guanyltransferase [Microbulbifer sp. NKW57]